MADDRQNKDQSTDIGEELRASYPPKPPDEAFVLRVEQALAAQGEHQQPGKRRWAPLLSVAAAVAIIASTVLTATSLVAGSGSDNQPGSTTPGQTTGTTAIPTGTSGTKTHVETSAATAPATAQPLPGPTQLPEDLPKSGLSWRRGCGIQPYTVSHQTTVDASLFYADGRWQVRVTNNGTSYYDGDLGIGVSAINDRGEAMSMDHDVPKEGPGAGFRILPGASWEGSVVPATAGCEGSDDPRVRADGSLKPGRYRWVASLPAFTSDHVFAGFFVTAPVEAVVNEDGSVTPA